MPLSIPGFQYELVQFNESVEKIANLFLISDYQVNPTIEAAAYLGEQTAEKLIRSLE